MRYGANPYRRVESGAMSPREIEAAAFAAVNRDLGGTGDAAARTRGLNRNQKLWSLLLRDLGSSGNRLPEPLRSDLVRLGAWALRETIAAMGDDSRSVAGLVALNEDMMAGLKASEMAGVPGSSAADGRGGGTLTLAG